MKLSSHPRLHCVIAPKGFRPWPTIIATSRLRPLMLTKTAFRILERTQDLNDLSFHFNLHLRCHPFLSHPYNLVFFNVHSKLFTLAHLCELWYWNLKLFKWHQSFIVRKRSSRPWSPLPDLNLSSRLLYPAYFHYLALTLRSKFYGFKVFFLLCFATHRNIYRSEQNFK